MSTRRTGTGCACIVVLKTTIEGLFWVLNFFLTPTTLFCLLPCFNLLGKKKLYGVPKNCVNSARSSIAANSSSTRDLKKYELMSENEMIQLILLRKLWSCKFNLISCLHLGHFFPHLSAADLRHFLQKLYTTTSRQENLEMVQISQLESTKVH